VGATVFTAGGAAAKPGGVPKWAIMAAVGIGGPVLGAIATALQTPALSAAAPLVPYKLPAAVTVLAMALYYWMTNMVSVARYRCKVKAPATVGVSSEFDRYLRVQVNMLEQLALFLPTLWLSAALVSPGAAAAAGVAWCAGRVAYARGYYADAAKRGAGFGVATLAQVYLLVLSGIGAARALLA
jgi:glutathione S-transferase